MSFTHIASRLFGAPLYVEPAKAIIILNVLQSRLGVAPVDMAAFQDPNLPEASRFYGTHMREKGHWGMSKVMDGVAIIPVIGALVNRGAWIGQNSSTGEVSYEGLAAQIQDAANDTEVHSILLDIDSPGGEATGLSALTDIIRAARDVKPVIAVANDLATSAAYAIASQATEFWVSPTTFTGSIGVIVMHVDESERAKMEGIKPTIITAGKKKAMANSLGPLTDEGLAYLTTMVDTFYEKFLATVELGRGDRFTAEAARKTEAAVIYGEDAVRIGLADRIGSFNEALEYLSTGAQERARSSNFGVGRMSEETKVYTEEDMESKVLASFENGYAEGVSEERTRIKEILGSEAASGRLSLAQHMAFETDMAADVAVSLLEKAAPEASARAVPSLEERLSGTENDVPGTPDVGASKPDWGPIYSSVSKAATKPRR